MMRIFLKVIKTLIEHVKKPYAIPVSVKDEDIVFSISDQLFLETHVN